MSKERLQEIAKELANNANMPYCWEDVYNRLIGGYPLPFKVEVKQSKTLIERNQMPTCICKSPKRKCKCGSSHWFKLYGTDDIVQCEQCGTWWKSKAKYMSTLPVKGLGK